MKNIYLIAAISLITIQSAIGQNYSDSTFLEQIDQARELIMKLKNEQNIPGVSIAVAKGGRIIWKEGIGYADIKNETQVTTETKFRMGSISKSITSIGLAKLFDNGQIEWSDPVSKYLSYPEAPEYTFTIQQLAGHTAGIRHYKGFEFFSNKQYSSIEHSLEVFKNDKLLFEPGTNYQYTTYGYSLIGRLMEEVSGKSFNDYMSKDVLSQLGMNHTILEDAGMDETGKATFYGKGGKREAKEVNLSVKWAGGGFLSTPTDLVNMVNYAGRFISYATLMDLITPQHLPDGTLIGYGIGFKIGKVESTGQTVVHHGGRISGARPYLLALLDQQLVIAICTNTEADYGVSDVYEIAQSFFKEQSSGE